MPSLKPKLTVNCGSMFSGKSTELLRQGQRHLLAGHKVVFLKPEMDNRYSEDEIVTHDGQKIKALAVDASQSLRCYHPVATAEVILIDEVQFFSWWIIKDIEALLRKGKVIYCSGLDLDYMGEPFSVVSTLLSIAEDVNKFKAVCSECGDDAYVSAKTVPSKTRVELGSQDKYKPVCRNCFYHIEEEVYE